MGIDPGVANTGFGVVRIAGGQMTAVDGGVVESPGDAPLESRLASIHAELEKLIAWHEPAAVALEDLYFNKNVRSALAVGQARGVAMLAAGQRGIPCFDYTPQAVKMAVCGSGSARQAPGPGDGRRPARPRSPAGVRSHRRRARGRDLPRRPRPRRAGAAEAAERRAVPVG